MAAANSTVITKQSNGNVLVESESGDYTLSPTDTLFKEQNGVIVRDGNNKTVANFKVAEVEKLVDPSASPSEVPINDIDTLFDELNENFFFEVTGGDPLPGALLAKTVTQNLVNGGNNIDHNLAGKVIIAFSVKDGDDFIAVDGNVVDANNFNIELAGGGPINNATIILIYVN